MSEELKACPFCGGRAYTHGRQGVLGTWSAYVKCIKCTSKSQFSGSAMGREYAEAAAIDRWNTRQPNV